MAPENDFHGLQLSVLVVKVLYVTSDVKVEAVLKVLCLESFVNALASVIERGRRPEAVMDTRQKVDGLKVFEIGKDMDNAANVHGQRDQECLKPKPKCNIRKSLAWDSAFFTSPGVLDPEELFQTLNLRDVGISLGSTGNGEQNIVPSESLKTERTSGFGKCDPRQSLAWDSAFFTSAGVLEPEELSMINKGFKKFESRTLDGIEELWRSVESNSTVNSTGGSPLTSLEIDLFEDIRGSAHRSTQVSNITTSTSNLQRGRHMKNVCSSQKVDASSLVRMKPMPTSRGKSITRNGLERVISEASVPPQAHHGAGTGEFNPKHAARSGELHLPSSLKPPKISKRANRISTAPTKRASWGTNHAKLETHNLEATSGNCLSGSKKPCLGVSSSRIRNSIPSPQSSLLSSPTATNESTISSSSSYSRLCGSAADTSGKSPFSSSRATATRHANLVATGSTFRTPPKYTTKKYEPGDSNPTCLLSMSKSSSCTPPASSIDGCSLESSSTSVNQESNNTKASFYTTMDTHQQDEPCFGYESQETSSPIQYVNKILAESSSVPSDVSRTIKPSSLRRPSPKIGFFDAENPTMPMINRGPQIHSGVGSTLSKSGTGIGAVNRTEYGKHQPPRTLKRTKNMKIGTQQTRVSSPALLIRPSYPVLFEEAENDFLEVSVFPGPVKDCFATTSRAQNNLHHRMKSKDCLTTKRLGDERDDAAKLGLGSTSKAEEKGNMSKMGRECDDQCYLKAKKHASRKHESGSIPHEDEKENLYGVEKQVESLSTNIGALDLSSDVMMEVREKRGRYITTEHQ